MEKIYIIINSINILMDENLIYRKLQQNLDKMPVGFPESKSGADIRILKRLFSLEEAIIANNLNILPETVSTIYKRIKNSKNSHNNNDKNNNNNHNISSLSIKQLETTLDLMVKKGLILPSIKKKKKSYSYALLAVGIYEFQVDRLSKEFAEDFSEYISAEFGKELYSTDLPQIRTIPIEKSINAEMKIQTYDNIRKIIEGLNGRFAVANCVCRQEREILGEHCKHTDLIETCIILPGAVDMYLNQGLAREITKEDVIEHLHKAEDAGLILQPGNTQTPVHICCCCGDCCNIITSAKRFPNPAELFFTNYYAKVDEELCTGCKKCISRCHMDAITIVDKKAIIDYNLCIGCGLCVPTCRSKAMSLNLKDKLKKPPKSTSSLYLKVLIKKVGLFQALKIGVKTMLGKKV